MSGARYEAAIWPGNGEERPRWAVAAYPAAVWYFPRSYGRKAAERMAARMGAGPRHFRTYERHGFLISRTAGADAPWRGWREDGKSFRADTLAGAFQMARKEKESI